MSKSARGDRNRRLPSTPFGSGEGIFPGHSIDDASLQIQILETQRRAARHVVHEVNNMLTIVTVCRDLLTTGLRPEGRTVSLEILAPLIQNASQLTQSFLGQEVLPSGSTTSPVPALQQIHRVLLDLEDQATALAKELPLVPEREKLAHIAEATFRARSLVEQFLSLGEREDLAPESIDLNQALKKAMPLLSCLSRAHVLRLTPAQSDLPVELIPQDLDLILVNLISNACDAMPEGGEVQIRTAFARFSADTACVPEALGPGYYARLFITDTGSGMTREVRDHLWEEHFTTKATGKGRGLGMSVIRQCLDRSGGHIFVWSQPGQGTRFELYWLLSSCERDTPRNGIRPCTEPT